MILAVALLSLACSDSNSPTGGTPTTMFQVTLQNHTDSFEHALSGVFDTPEGAGAPGPIGPGQAYVFTFGAVPGQKLSFATMFVHSNDLFYAPDGGGIELFDMGGTPVSGDVTSQVSLWDAGTEVNQEPGVGADQAPRQAAANTGAADGDTTVRPVNDGFTYPAPSAVLQVTLTPLGDNEFRARIENVSTTGTLVTSMNDMLSVPLAPGVWVVTAQDDALFTTGVADAGTGLEALAEDGNAGPLGATLAAVSGLQSPIAPGVWAVHSMTAPLFASGAPDRGDGLESLAEDGDPTALAAATAQRAGVVAAGVYNTPVGASTPGPALPGGSFQFTVMASPGQFLSLASMLGQSNDLFFAPSEMGIELFPSGTAVSGDVTAQIQLWDAGTEANQFPGVGPDQAPRQSAPDTGAADSNNTVRPVSDGYPYPDTDSMLRVTITPLP
jgi:hypothetical protein